jgi:hypothetical protein
MHPTTQTIPAIDLQQLLLAWCSAAYLPIFFTCFATAKFYAHPCRAQGQKCLLCVFLILYCAVRFIFYTVYALGGHGW